MTEEEDVPGLERAELGAGLVIADAEEVIVCHVLEAGNKVAVTIVVDPAATLPKGSHPGGAGGGSSIVRSGSGPRQRTC